VFDVHRAQVFGRCEDTTGIVPFGRLVEQVMTTEPYASAKRVFWIVDNGSSHRGHASVDRVESTWPTVRLIHLPVHASWLDQAEIYFSIGQRKVVNPNDFTDTDQIVERLAAFEQRYNAMAEPFDWRFWARRPRQAHGPPRNAARRVDPSPTIPAWRSPTVPDAP
jgi:hypothetical protein